MSSQTILYRDLAPMQVDVANEVLDIGIDGVLHAVAEALARTAMIRDGARTLGVQVGDEFVAWTGMNKFKARLVHVVDDGPMKVMLTRDLTVMSSHEAEKYDRVIVTIGLVGEAAWAVTDLAAWRGHGFPLGRTVVLS